MPTIPITRRHIMIQHTKMISRDVFPLISKTSLKAFTPLNDSEIKGNTTGTQGKYFP